LPHIFLMLLAVVGVWLTGALVAMPAVAWWSRDIGRIPRRVWYWSGYHRRPWRWGVLLGLVTGGVLALVVVAAWARSQERYELLAETRELLAEHDA
jgi:hypothetical protein